MTGRMIAHYRIQEKLGEGGMGVVYRATDTRLNRNVALKFLSTRSTATDNDRKRFIQEARAASALDHPNICTIYEVHETPDGDLVIVMPAYDGQTLSRLIENGPLDIVDTVETAARVAEGLMAAHEKGIVHRDLKAGNILVTTRGQIKIIDFGLARVDGVTQLTQTGTIVGTVPYMSPEQARGEKPDAGTDIWSLGVLIYEMASGRHPFKSDYSAAVVYAILNEDPAPLTSLRSDIPLGLERLVAKCMQKDRNFRYRSIEEVLVDLRTLQRDFSKGTDPVRTPSIPTGAAISGHDVGQRQATLTRKTRLVPALVAVSAVIALAAAALFLYPSSHTARTGEIRSLAVLPLTNLSGDPDQEYFSDGMTDALIADLAGIEALRVISRTTIMQYKGTTKSLPEIARELNVDAVVEASVMRSGEQVRITARLIHGLTERHLWSGSYMRNLTDILILQSDVARAIAGEIRIQITPRELNQLASAPQVNAEAYEAILKGWYFWNMRTPESLNRATDYFEQAIAIDPDYADAHRGLAATKTVKGVFFANPHEVLPEAVASTMRALELDERVTGANLALGVINKYYHQDREAALRYINRAMELHPGMEHVYNVRGMFYTSVGRFDEAKADFRKALSMDPLSLAMNTDFGWSYYLMGEYDNAILQCRKALDIDPGFLTAITTIAAAHTIKGEYDKALSILEPALKKDGVIRLDGPSLLLAELGYTYAVSGNPAEARSILGELEKRSQQEYTDPYFMAMIYLALDETGLAFEWLYKAQKGRSSRLAWLDVDPKLNRIRNDARFVEFGSKTGYGS